MRILFFIFPLLIGLVFSAQSHSASVVLKEINGQEIPFDSLKGKWVLINYWASWCQPCLDEIKELNHFYQARKDKIALFAVNYDMLPIANQMELIKKFKINYPSLQIDPGPQLALGQVQGVPATYIFNPQGQLSEVLYGGQTLASLSKAVIK